MNDTTISTLQNRQYLLIVAVMVLALSAPAQTSGEESVEVVQTSDGRVIYKYTDAEGNVAFQDRPPPEFFDVELEDVEEVQPEVDARSNVTAPLPPAKSIFLPWIMLAIAGLMLLAGLYVLLAPKWQRRLNESKLERCLRKAGMYSFTNVHLKSGARSQVEVDRIVKTPAGILVLGEERLSGTIMGTTDSDFWRQTGGDDEVSMANPLLRVQHASKIIKELVGEIPVFGRVVYDGRAKFANGVPPTVRSISALRKGLDHYTEGEVESRRIDAAWRRLMQFPRSNAEPLRILGVGWQGWLHRYWRETLAGVLGGLSVVFFLIATFLLFWTS